MSRLPLRTFAISSHFETRRERYEAIEFVVEFMITLIEQDCDRDNEEKEPQ